MHRFVGGALIATGIGHVLLGLFLFREALAGIVGEGIANTICDGQYEREAAFWFLLFGPVCALLGQLVNHAGERGDRRLSSLIGWNLLAIGAVGALVMPVSGFWILIALAPLALRSVAPTHAPAARQLGG